MPLTTLDTTEDRNFAEGETVFDVDGNSYTVRKGHAELNLNDGILYKLSGDMRNCFSRKNPKASPLPITPGPWEAHLFRVHVPGMGTVAVVENPWNNNARRIANTKAIAAVPAMIAALISARKVLALSVQSFPEVERELDAALKLAGIEP
jgi:hypothetical protein